MKDNTYTLLNKFECCGNTMVNVIIKGKAAHVMSESDYKRILIMEKKYGCKKRI